MSNCGEAIDPTAWFDQFMQPGLVSKSGQPWPPDEWPATGQWCARHWAPCPVMGANGIGAVVEMQQIWLQELVPDGIKPGDVTELNNALMQAGHVCCTLGDQRMYEIWGKWPPAMESAR